MVRALLFPLSRMVLGVFLLMVAWVAGDGHARADSPSAQQPPIRISRSFFESAVEGAIRIQGTSAASAIDWDEQPQPIDHPGCARFEQAGALQLCFTLMNDVDSFGLNKTEMVVSGLKDYLDDRVGPPCPGLGWDVSLVSVSRLPTAGTSKAVTSFTVSYLAQAPSGSGCNAAPAEVDLTLQKL